MKQIFLCLTVLTLVLISCTSDSDVSNLPPCDPCAYDCISDTTLNVITNACDSNFTCDFAFYELTQFDDDIYSGISSGQNTVFSLSYQTEGDLLVADDEYASILIIEIDEGLESFTAHDQELENFVYYKLSCFCIDVSFRTVRSGCIQASKISADSWRIMGDLLVETGYQTSSLRFDAVFTK